MGRAEPWVGRCGNRVAPAQVPFQGVDGSAQPAEGASPSGASTDDEMAANTETWVERTAIRTRPAEGTQDTCAGPRMELTLEAGPAARQLT